MVKEVLSSSQNRFSSLRYPSTLLQRVSSVKKALACCARAGVMMRMLGDGDEDEAEEEAEAMTVEWEACFSPQCSTCVSHPQVLRQLD